MSSDSMERSFAVRRFPAALRRNKAEDACLFNFRQEQ